MTAVPRGRCPACRFRWRLRRDGTLQVHHLYSGWDRNPDPCPGSGKPPLSPDPRDCSECMSYAASHPHLAGACASVGIERGKSTGQVMLEYLQGYHECGHQEPPQETPGRASGR